MYGPLYVVGKNTVKFILKCNELIYIAGVVAHLASDGVGAWKMQTPDRNMVLSRMVRAIKRSELV